MVKNAAHVACAALNEVRQEHSRQRVPPNGTFEVRQSTLRPSLLWLLLRRHRFDSFSKPCGAVASVSSQLQHAVANTNKIGAAAARSMSDLKSQGSCLVVLPVQLLGLDYLIDSNSHPWLLEVNGTPSLAVAHHDPAVEQLIQDAKVRAV
jgi:hypothetical protein